MESDLLAGFPVSLGWDILNSWCRLLADGTSGVASRCPAILCGAPELSVRSGPETDQLEYPKRAVYVSHHARRKSSEIQPFRAGG